MHKWMISQEQLRFVSDCSRLANVSPLSFHLVEMKARRCSSQHTENPFRHCRKLISAKAWPARIEGEKMSGTNGTDVILSARRLTGMGYCWLSSQRGISHASMSLPARSVGAVDSGSFSQQSSTWEMLCLEEIRPVAFLLAHFFR